MSSAFPRSVFSVCLAGLAGCVSPGDRLVRVRAAVVSYSSNANWDHYDDGRFTAWDVATLDVREPAAWRGKRLSLLCSAQPEDSLLRRTGMLCEFEIQEKYLIGECPGREPGTSIRYVPGPGALQGVRRVRDAPP